MHSCVYVMYMYISNDMFNVQVRDTSVNDNDEEDMHLNSVTVEGLESSDTESSEAVRGSNECEKNEENEETDDGEREDFNIPEEDEQVTTEPSMINEQLSMDKLIMEAKIKAKELQMKSKEREVTSLNRFMYFQL